MIPQLDKRTERLLRIRDALDLFLLIVATLMILCGLILVVLR